MPDISPYSGTLGTRLAAHLLRRTTFGATKAQILDFANKTVSDAVAQLLTFNPITNKPYDTANGLDVWTDTVNPPAGSSSPNDRLRNFVFSWYLDNARTDLTIRSKMILFLHQNWIVDEKSFNSFELYDYLKLLEFYCLGSYKVLANKMTKDNRMLVFLNGYQNVVDTTTGDATNENYGREFLELFTIGKGPQIGVGDYTNYTEADIKQAAKLLSGWGRTKDDTIRDADTGLRCGKPKVAYHAQDNKTFSAAFQNTTIVGTNTVAGIQTELDQFVNMVFNQRETARNISRKLYRFFVKRTITAAVETAIIEEMATTLLNNNYNLQLVLSQLLKSKHFYDLDDANSSNNTLGAIIKSPLDILYNALRFFKLDPTQNGTLTQPTIYDPFYHLAVHVNFLETSNFNLFKPTTVAGYPSYYGTPTFDRSWFDTSTITQRYYLGKDLISNTMSPYGNGAFGVTLNTVTWVAANISTPNNANAVVDEIVNYLFCEIPDTNRKNYFFNILTGNIAGSAGLLEWQYEWNNYLNTNNNSIVKQRLDLLIKSIIYSPEFQIQ